MTTYQQFLGKFHLGSDANSLSVGGTAVTLTVGDYYLCGYTGEATAQLCEHLQAQIRAIGATQDATTVTYSGATGRVTIALETSATLSFTDAALASLLGYTSTLYVGQTIVAEAQPRYVWRPSEGLSDYPVHLATWWAQRSTGVVQRSPNGSIALVAGQALYDGRFRYDLLPLADVMTTPGTTRYESLEQFWADVLSVPMPFRCYADRTLSTAANVFEAVLLPSGDEGLGTFTGYATRHFQEVDNLWNVELKLGKYVAPA